MVHFFTYLTSSQEMQVVVIGKDQERRKRLKLLHYKLFMPVAETATVASSSIDESQEDATLCMPIFVWNTHPTILSFSDSLTVSKRTLKAGRTNYWPRTLGEETR